MKKFIGLFLVLGLISTSASATTYLVKCYSGGTVIQSDYVNDYSLGRNLIEYKTLTGQRIICSGTYTVTEIN